MQMAVKMIIGNGSSISLMMKLKAEEIRARKLQAPMAVEANRVGKR